MSIEAAESDIDLLVDLTPGGGNELLRVAGISEELSELLGTRVDVVAAPLLRGERHARYPMDVDRGVRQRDCQRHWVWPQGARCLGSIAALCLG